MCPKSVPPDDKLFNLAQRMADAVPQEATEIAIAMAELMSPEELRRTLAILYRPRDFNIINK